MTDRSPAEARELSAERIVNTTVITAVFLAQLVLEDPTSSDAQRKLARRICEGDRQMQALDVESRAA